jgi:hypothetical protein
MLWPVLIVAAATSVLVAIACFALGLRKLTVIVPAQVALSFGVSYGIAVRWIQDMPSGEAELAWTCLLAALFIPATWVGLRLILGPLQRRRGKIADSHADRAAG